MEIRKRYREEFSRGFRSERIVSDFSKCGVFGAGVVEVGVDRF